jgi:serine/threonine-protein kinase
MKISQPGDPLLGQALGIHQRYVLQQRIGGGGMGEVFLATDTLLGRSVALKLLSSKLASEPMRKRFEREVAVCAALKSDHIVQVFDYGVTVEGYPFFVMEYLVGQTLGQLLKLKRRLSIEQTVNLITQVCAGLHLAHQGMQLQWQGAPSSQTVKVVHRDLKPDNIFLVPTALGEFVKILDFGIAKIRSDHTEQTNLTDMFMGTYQYASPEQLRAEKDLDERADIYSLGMILYKMLTGTAPFDFAVEPHADLQPSGAVWAVAHLTKPPIPLRQQPGCKHLPLELESILMRCLQKSPNQRFASVLELSQALQMVIAQQQNDRPAVEQTPTVPPQIPAAHRGIQKTVPAAAAVPVEPQRTEQLTEMTEAYQALNTLNHDPAATTRHPAPPRRASLLWFGVGISLTSVLAVVGMNWLRPSTLLKPPAPSPSMPVSSPVPLPTPRLSPMAPAPPANSPVLESAKTLSGHTDTVWAIATSAEGQTLVSGSFDKTIRLWDLPTGTWRQTLSGHTDAVRAVAISADSKTLVSGSGDKTLKVWNLNTGELIRTIEGHVGPIWTVALSPNGHTLASGSYDGTIKIWDVSSGELRQTIPEDYDSIWSLAISPDGKTLASGSYGSTIKLWDLQTGTLIRTLSGHQDAVRSIAISPDGNTLVSGSWDKTINVWNLQTGTLIRTLSGHADRVLSVAISPDGQTIASGGVDRTIKVWRLSTGTLLRTLSDHTDWVISVTFTPDGQTIASGSKDQSIKLWRW